MGLDKLHKWLRLTAGMGPRPLTKLCVQSTGAVLRWLFLGAGARISHSRGHLAQSSLYTAHVAPS